VSSPGLALVLLTGALLMLRSMQKLLAVNSQFRPNRLLSMKVDIDSAYMNKAYRESLPDDVARTPFEQFEQRIMALPGVEAVALADGFPPVPHQDSWEQFKANGGGGLIANEFQPADMHIVTPEYFDMMGARLVRGRWFADSDVSGSLPVAVINEAMAEAYWPNLGPLGVSVKPKFRFTDQDVGYTIVGSSVSRNNSRAAKRRCLPFTWLTRRYYLPHLSPRLCGLRESRKAWLQRCATPLYR
jgi:hypothetical protein